MSFVPTDLEGFVHRSNIAHFRQQLEITTDTARRHTILKLLAAEEACGPCPPYDDGLAPRRPFRSGL